MINEQTVLVLGAGASRDLGFPTGERLWQDIYSFVLNQSRGYVKNRSSIREDNSKLLARFLDLAELYEGVETETSDEFVRKFAEELFNAQPISIDQFLSDRPEYSLLTRQLNRAATLHMQFWDA